MTHLLSSLSLRKHLSLELNRATPTPSPSCCLFFMTCSPNPWPIAVAFVVSSTLVITVCCRIRSLKIFLISSAVILATVPLLVISRQISLLLLRKQKPQPYHHHPTNKLEDNGTSIVEKVEITGGAIDLMREPPVARGPNTEAMQCGGEESDNHSFLNSVDDGSSDSESVTSGASAVIKETNGLYHEQLEFLDDDSCCDGSISDEESLIEIDLPNGHYINPRMKSGLKEEIAPTLCSFPHMLWSRDYYSHESLQFDWQPRNLMMELLAEINEKTLQEQEESFIEIDISIGSVKYSGFQIEA